MRKRNDYKPVPQKLRGVGFWGKVMLEDFKFLYIFQAVYKKHTLL